MKMLREFFHGSHNSMSRRRLGSNERCSTNDTKQPQWQMKENGARTAQSMKQYFPKISKPKASDEGVHHFSKTLCGCDTITKSGEIPSNKTCELQLGKQQTRASSLQQLLHVEEEPFRLWELLQIKEEVSIPFIDKVPDLLKKPWNLRQEKHQKSPSAAEPLKTPLMQEFRTKPSAHITDVMTNDSSQTLLCAPPLAIPPACTDCATGFTTPYAKSKSVPSTPIYRTKKNRCKKPSILLEVACKVLKPDDGTYCHACLPLGGKFLCLRDTPDHHILAGNGNAVNGSSCYSSSVVLKEFRSCHSVKEPCMRSNDWMKLSDLNSSSEQEHCDGVEHKVDRRHLKSNELNWDLEDCYIFESGQNLSKNTEEFQNYIHGKFSSPCTSVLQRARSLKERILPPSSKNFLHRSHSLKESIMASRLFCFSGEPVWNEISDNGTPEKPQKQISPKHTLANKEERLQTNKVHPSDDLQANVHFVPQGIWNEAFQQKNHDRDRDREDTITASRPSHESSKKFPAFVAAPDLPSSIGFCQLTRVPTLRDALSTSIDKDFRISDRERLSTTCEQACHLDLDFSGASGTCHSPNIGNAMENELAVTPNLYDQECEGPLSPTSQKKIFFDGITSCKGVGGSEPLSEWCTFEGDCQPSPVSILDSHFIDESPSPENTETISDSEKQLMDCHDSSDLRPLLEMTNVEKPIGSFDGFCHTGGNAYFLLEKVVYALLHTYQANDVKDTCSEGCMLLQNAYSCECHPHLPNLEVCPAGNYQDGSLLQGDKSSTLDGVGGYPHSSRNSKMLLEMLDSQMLEDCVTEALEFWESTESYCVLSSRLLVGVHKHTAFKTKFLQNLFQTICSWSRQTGATIESLLQKDVNSSLWKFSSIKLELSEIGSQIECKLFELLISDAVFDMMDFNQIYGGKISAIQ